jgi:hypothetical protein
LIVIAIVGGRCCRSQYRDEALYVKREFEKNWAIAYGRWPVGGPGSGNEMWAMIAKNGGD